jgi:hypothetical protein
MPVALLCQQLTAPLSGGSSRSDFLPSRNSVIGEAICRWFTHLPSRNRRELCRQYWKAHARDLGRSDGYLDGGVHTRRHPDEAARLRRRNCWTSRMRDWVYRELLASRTIFDRHARLRILPCKKSCAAPVLVSSRSSRALPGELQVSLQR